jgi:hypothetical protein
MHSNINRIIHTQVEVFIHRLHQSTHVYVLQQFITVYITHVYIVETFCMTIMHFNLLMKHSVTHSFPAAVPA